MFIKIKFTIDTHTKDIYFLYKRNVDITQWNLNICIISTPG